MVEAGGGAWGVREGCGMNHEIGFLSVDCGLWEPGNENE